MSTPSCLITGSLGWVGSRLTEVLVQGLPDNGQLHPPALASRIRCLIMPEQDPTPLRHISQHLEIVRGDIRSRSDCERFCEGATGAILFHTAGIIHPPRVADFYSVNVTGTTNLLDAAVRGRVKRAVIVSSNSPCGCNPHPDHLFDELSPYRPYLNYGRSKMLMERAVQETQNQGLLETVIIRPPWFYGPNQPPRQTLFFKLIRQGKVPIVGSGENLRSMSYIDNLCQGLVLAGTKEMANGQTYWIADERPYTMNQIVDTAERLLEVEFGYRCAHKRVRLPAIASSIAYFVDALLQRLGLYHQKVHVLSEMNKTIACSVAKAKRELGYLPVVSLEEGLRRSLRWCQEQGLAL